MFYSRQAYALLDYLKDSGMNAATLEAIGRDADQAMREFPDALTAHQVQSGLVVVETGLQKLWGDDYERRVEALQRFADELDQRKPGFIEFMGTWPQVSNLPTIAARLALYADRKYFSH